MNTIAIDTFGSNAALLADTELARMNGGMTGAEIGLCIGAGVGLAAFAVLAAPAIAINGAAAILGEGANLLVGGALTTVGAGIGAGVGAVAHDVASGAEDLWHDIF